MAARYRPCVRIRLQLALLSTALLAASCSSADSGVSATRADAEATAAAPATDSVAPTETTTPDSVSDTADDTTVDPTQPATTAPDVSDPKLVDPDGLGDELYPPLGNPGYDVQHYDVDLTYDGETQQLDAVVGIDVVALDARDEFTLDATFTGVESVVVDGAPATFVEDSPELRISLTDSWAAGDAARVEITYSIIARPQVGADQFPIGWFNTAEGSYVLNEPDGARSWLPSNDHPSDKATFRFVIHTAPGITGVANGRLVEHTVDAAGETWVWDNTDPTATYLLLVLTGDYEIIEGVGPDGLPLLSVVLRQDRELMQPYIDTMAAQIDFFDGFFGAYPLSTYGLAMTDSFGGLAMETTGRSLFSREDFADGVVGYLQDLLLAHELAHQWFGDAVTPAVWKDIWLNESFATYAQWMWLAEAGYATVDEQAREALGARDARSTAEPTASDLFGFNSYDGGATILHALRLTVGDATFFAILRDWVADNSGTSQSTADFIALAERVAERDLTEFFDTWLFAAKVPAAFPVPTGFGVSAGFGLRTASVGG